MRACRSIHQTVSPHLAFFGWCSEVTLNAEIEVECIRMRLSDSCDSVYNVVGVVNGSSVQIPSIFTVMHFSLISAVLFAVLAIASPVEPDSTGVNVVTPPPTDGDVIVDRCEHPSKFT